MSQQLAVQPPADDALGVGETAWVAPSEPRKMRLFVRVKGSSSFVLLADDNLLLEHYKEIAVKYFKERWTGVRQCPELILVRCLCFNNKDRLLDFKRRMRNYANPLDIQKPTTSTAEVGEVYSESFNADLVKQNMVVTDPFTPALIGNCETELVVKNLSLDRLIIKITDPNTAQYVAEVFWDTYREYARPQIVLQKLLERYEVPALVRIGEPQRSPADHALHQMVKYKIQMKVIELLEHWVSEMYYDFTDDMQKTLSRWVRTRIDRDGIPTKLLHLMKQKEKNRKPLSAWTVPPPPAVSRADFDPQLVREPVTVLADFSAFEIASQLTILTLHLHNNLLPCEFMGCKWLPGNDMSHKAPNFRAYRDLISKVANWVEYAIVSEENFDTRINIVKKLYLVCQELRQMTNWDMLVAVHGGISALPSASLRNTHYHVENKELGPLVQELNEMLAHHGKTKIFQDSMIQKPDVPQPVFPSIVVYLKQLEMMEEHPAEADGVINFFRMALQHNLIKHLLQSKGVKLPYQPIPKLLAVFTLYKIKDQQDLIQMAYRCEPPQPEHAYE
ncbi:Ras guanine nucleotide exchange factor R [Diplonema papillatum]|nr:Ras guanine nucleotide exchange factor R [Diplonema papillatum]